jgi:hypothetical protein
MSDDMLVRIRGEVARRIRQEHEETGAPFTAIVDRRMAEVYADLDRRRERREWKRATDEEIARHVMGREE